MRLARRKFLHLAAGSAAAGPYCGSAFALDYPTRPITIVVPFAAGGATDVLARVLADPIGKSLGQTLIVEDVTGRRRQHWRVARGACNGRRLHAQRRHSNDTCADRWSLQTRFR